MKSIVWICPGGIAHYPGQIGDVFVCSSITQYLQEIGYKIHFITNEIMYNFLKKTYSFDISFMKKVNNKLVLSEEDLERAKTADFIFVLKHFNEEDGNFWEEQLLSFNIKKEKICRVGNLNSFALNGPHIQEQVLDCILERIKEKRPNKLIYPLLKIDDKFFREKRLLYKEKFDYAILPFAGDKRKWLTEDIITNLVSNLKGNICIFYSSSGEELKFILKLKRSLESTFPNVKFLATSIETICAFSCRCKEIFCVDSGVTWGVVAGFNWLVLNKNLKKEEYPLIKIVFGKDITKNLLPTSSVWLPLSIYPEKIKAINEKQELVLKDVNIDMILN